MTFEDTLKELLKVAEKYRELDALRVDAAKKFDELKANTVAMIDKRDEVIKDLREKANTQAEDFYHKLTIPQRWAVAGIGLFAAFVLGNLAR